MPNILQEAGALSEPSNFAPLHTNRIFTGLWTNRSLLRDAATNDYQEHFGMGRQDSILGGFNSEISASLTLKRRYGSSVYGGATAVAVPPVRRFYSFNTFTLTDELIRVMADTTATVYDVTGGAATVIWTKATAAQDGKHPTYFLGVGNLLFFTNGVENKQWDYINNIVTDWGVADPTQAPNASISAGAAYGQWAPGIVIQRTGAYGGVYLVDANNNVQFASIYGRTGAAEPTWLTAQGDRTPDGTVSWEMVGNGQWIANHQYGFGVVVILYVTAGDGNTYFYQNQGSGVTGATPPGWLTGLNSVTPDNGYAWINMGRVLHWADIGATTTVGGQATILDASGSVQQCQQAGKTGTTTPAFQQINGVFTPDPAGSALEGQAIWQNIGSVASVQYGYAYMNSKTEDISNMSPASFAITTSNGESVTVTGPGTGGSGVDTVIVFRTAHGGSTFLYDGQLTNPGSGQTWTFNDNTLDADLNTEWQAQRAGEGTPLPVGATCLGYHVSRIFAAVGNVVWVSSGPDATVGGSSGNAGFDTQLVAQSKITRFWACSLGMVVFTVRDAYIILGSATDTDPLYMVVFIENLPLRNYDCFTVNKTTPYLLMGNNQLVSLDPSAGIIEAGFPIADRLMEEYDASASFVTFHSQSSLDNALYVATGAVVPPGSATSSSTGQWYRMAQNNAPEQGSAWSTKAILAGRTMGCVQSVEVTPGVYRLLISGTAAGPIWQRDPTKNTDNGTPYPVQTVFGNIVLALPGQLAALFFITLESVKTGTRAGLALLLGELSGTFETLKRTRQDPPILPPSNTLYSDRYHFMQNQSEAWCRHFQMEVTWPAEDAANELLTFTVFGQTWQEMRSQ
jgi:hypothetical protein